jgi:hypothetical protein
MSQRENQIIAAVRCPVCGVAVGQGCRTRDGRPLTPKGVPVPRDLSTLRPIVHPQRRQVWVAMRLLGIEKRGQRSTVVAPAPVRQPARQPKQTPDGFACATCNKVVSSEAYARRHCDPSRVAKRTGYRTDPDRHKAAREKVPPKRRAAIAAAGGAAYRKIAAKRRKKGQ